MKLQKEKERIRKKNIEILVKHGYKEPEAKVIVDWEIKQIDERYKRDLDKISGSLLYKINGKPELENMKDARR